jgi:hypothetical protein
MSVYVQVAQTLKGAFAVADPTGETNATAASATSTTSLRTPEDSEVVALAVR